MAMAGAMMQAKSMSEPDFARHGGRIDDALAAYPDAPRPWIDLSTGINPVPWPVPQGLLVDPAPLPSTTALADLERVAARHFGVEARHVAAVPGSEIALRLLPMLGVPLPIVAAVPSYGTHREVASEAVAPAEVDRVRGGTLLIANPNNPDGHLLDRADLHILARQQAELGGWLVVDEAFADTDPAPSIAAVGEDAPVIAMRSFGKFFGLAGIRLGFVIAPAVVIAALRGLLGDWPVSAQAIGWGRAAYADREWIEATRIALAERARRLDAMLARHGLSARGASPLFRLVEHPDAGAIFERLGRAGILARPFADRADWLRFGLPADDAAFDRLDQVLAHG